MFPTASISGQSDTDSYCQSLNIANFHIVILLKGLSRQEEMTLGHNLVSKLEETIGQTSGVTPSDLVTTLSQPLGSDQIQLSLLVAKIEGQKLWISGLGKMEAKLVRKGTIINLLSESADGPKNVNGPIQHNDFLVLGTTAFVSSVPLPELSQLQMSPVEEVKEKMIARLESKDNRSELAAQFVWIDLTSPKTGAIVEPTEMTLPPPPPIVDSPNITEGSPQPSLLQRLRPKGLWLPKALSDQNPSSRRILYLAAVIFIIFVCAVSFQLRSKNLETNSKNFSMIERQVNEGISSASKLSGINDQIARETLLQSKKDATAQIETLYGSDWKNKDLPDKKRLLELLGKIDAQIEKTSHVYEVSILPTFYDFSLMKSGPKIVSANLHDGKIVALDGANGAVYSVATQNKGAELITGSNDLKNSKLIDSTLDSMFVFSSKGIISKKLSGGDALKQVAPLSSKFGEIKSLGAFGGNLYLLDPKNNQVWKLQGTDSGFSEPINYIMEGLSMSIVKGISMSIDGFVYVLTSSGQILKFAGGDVSEFSISGLPEELKSPSAFFTSDQVENIYVWDSGGRAVFVLNKKGLYQAEYKLSSEIGHSPPVTGILADENVKKIFLLSDSKVYSIDIK